MLHLFIINPAAGSRDQTKEYRQRIEAAFAGREELYRIEVSQCPGDCTRIAREAVETGGDVRIYACGGDGTLNEVVNGVAGFPNGAVTVFSGGSGNDFVKLFDEPKAFFDLERLLDPQEATFDLIRCNDRLSINICSVGLDARIGTDVGRYKRIPLLTGFRAYAVSTAINVCKAIAEHYIVEVNGETIDGEQTFVCVCNGRFYGGGFHPVPEADPADGLLDILLVKKVSLLQVAGLIGKFKNGRHKEITHVARHLLTKKITVRCDKETPVNVDGELLQATRVEMSVAEEKLRFFYPKGLEWRNT